MVSQVYKIKGAFIKKAESKGFFVGASEDNTEKVYARKICLAQDTSIMKRTIVMLEEYYKNATDEEKKTDFAEFKFDKDGKIEYEPKLGECYLCFSVKNKPKNILFIAAPDGREYYNIDVLNTHCGELIQDLIKSNCIDIKRI